MPRTEVAFYLALAYPGLGQEDEARKWYQDGVHDFNALGP